MHIKNTLSNEFEKYSKKILRSKKSAKKFLIRIGVNTPTLDTVMLVACGILFVLFVFAWYLLATM